MDTAAEEEDDAELPAEQDDDAEVDTTLEKTLEENMELCIWPLEPQHGNDAAESDMPSVPVEAPK